MTARSVPEWQGRTPNTAPPASVKARIILRQGGICACGCGVKLGMAGEPIEFDHTQALILGGENREGNLRALRPACHGAKTKADVRQKSTEARKRAKHFGLKPKGRGFRCWRRFNGEIVYRERTD